MFGKYSHLLFDVGLTFGGPNVLKGGRGGKRLEWKAPPKQGN